MLLAKTHTQSLAATLISKVSDYTQLVKVRLTSLVVFSSMMGYLLGMNGVFNIPEILLLTVGGFSVTGGANSINQILERHYDNKMERTANRPLPANRITVLEAATVALILSIIGAATLFFLDPLCMVLGLLALVIYAFLYTPLKRISSTAVIVGAIPGALPAVIGWAGATHSIGMVAWLLFAIQFVWQFPHTWAIAWMLHEDYEKAGFKMLPSNKAPGKFSALQIFVYTLLLLPVSLLPAKFGVTGIFSTVIVLIAGLAFIATTVKLYRECSKNAALVVMLGSFVYLPLVQLALVMDKLFFV